MPGKTLFRSILFLVIGIIVGAVGMWGYSLARGVTPRIVEGYSNGVNYDISAMGLSEELGGEGEGYRIEGAMWREFGGPWNQSGTPPSLTFPSYGQKVRLGVIDYEPTEDAFGSTAVVWLEILDTRDMVQE